MKKLRPIAAVSFLITLFCGCSPQPVQWHEPNAQWKGVVHTSGLNTFLDCCDPGDNCARRHYSLIQPINQTLRSYVANDNLAGYFRDENWRLEFPELSEHTDLINFIINNNPKAQITFEDDIIIYRDRNQNNTSDNIFYAQSRTAGDPCNN